MLRPRTVAIDARLAAYRGGGIAEHTRRLLAGIAALPEGEQAPWRVTVLAHRNEADALRAGAVVQPDDRADDVFPRRHLRTPPHHRLESLALPVDAALAGCPPRGLLHCPDVAVPSLWFGPIVATVHDVAFLRHPERLTADSVRHYARVHRTVRRAARVIAVSDHTARELTALTRIDPRRIRVVANAVDDRFRPADGPAEADADRAVCARLGLIGPFILFVSTIEPRKNVGVLLDAFAALARDRADLTLVLAGADGWQSESITAHARDLGLGDRLRFLGWVSDDDLVALYRTARCLAHPAVDEGFGLTPLEAMACGTPTVVSDAGSLPEVTGDAALVVPPDQPDAWAAALTQVLDDAPLARCMAGAGRARAESFTLQRMARATLAVYREAAAGERR